MDCLHFKILHKIIFARDNNMRLQLVVNTLQPLPWHVPAWQTSSSAHSGPHRRWRMHFDSSRGGASETLKTRQHTFLKHDFPNTLHETITSFTYDMTIIYFVVIYFSCKYTTVPSKIDTLLLLS